MTLPKKAPIGVDNFAELIDKKRNYLFVDKTLMIKELIDSDEKVALILRPRRWGKSMNMSMLKYFFTPLVRGLSTSGMFDELNIAKEDDGRYIKEYQGKHPVITISFKDVKELTFEVAIGKIGILIYNVINEFADLPNFFDNFQNLKDLHHNLLHKKATNEDLQESFKLLSECLYQYYNQKVVIIIDEYDAPLNASYSNPELFEQLVNFFKGFFGAAFKGNDALEKGVMTGILRLSKNNMLSDLNNLRLYSMSSDQYSDSFGFFEDDVKELFAQANVECDLPAIKSWYNGYKCGQRDGIYNPWSIVNCIRDKGKLAPYWIKTGNDDLLRDIFVNSGTDIQEEIQTLLAGGSVRATIDDFISFDQIKEGHEELLWSALWALGYLKISGETKLFGSMMECNLVIPNREVDCSYRSVFIWFFRSMRASKRYYHAVEALVAGDVENFISGLRDFMKNSVSYHDLRDETHYHILILGMLSVLKEDYIVVSNRESGYGRFDIALAPYDRQKDFGIIIEFKKEKVGQPLEFYEQKAKDALMQIKEKKYDACFSSHKNLKKILNLAMVFCGKEVIFEYSLNKLDVSH
jgi:hypothetical protein